ncbi:hydroxymyristoyl-ACP dehydratase [Thiorhodococcus mannitoliphagus]|uniref:Hydroxymyristoyl-ACP dehydratase n=1 Tax=Thiorhodococcus mannitoliphagus TaxID=329406 RepID=A0A6P1DR90_9GAMM|nr:hydroxymyristoyl-ACP dehydratase [Thiorhodococcus mannitoliphagus]NEX20399.1 hydroxymyristoyl-ACP dehydratase [Thiorhodococcus mannitoliphagus]
MTSPLDRDWILAHIPHQGAMCLNDQVDAWDGDKLCCTAWSHASPENPLRIDGRLSPLAGIEYAAQAVAIHGALHGAGSSPGMLGSVRGLTSDCGRLDTLEGPLRVEVTRLGGDTRALLYAFDVQGEGRCLLSGRLTIVLTASAEPSA